jgi:hypothetical protein
MAALSWKFFYRSEAGFFTSSPAMVSLRRASLSRRRHRR